MDKTNNKIVTIMTSELKPGSIIACDIYDVAGKPVLWKKQILYDDEIMRLKGLGITELDIYRYNIKDKNNWEKMVTKPQFFSDDQITEACRMILRYGLDIPAGRISTLLKTDNFSRKALLIEYISEKADGIKFVPQMLDCFGENRICDKQILKYLNNNVDVFKDENICEGFVSKLKQSKDLENLKSQLMELASNNDSKILLEKIAHQAGLDGKYSEKENIFDLFRIFKGKVENSEVRKKLNGKTLVDHVSIDADFDEFLILSNDEIRSFVEQIEMTELQDAMARLSGNVDEVISLSPKIKDIPHENFDATFYSEYIYMIFKVYSCLINNQKFDNMKFQRNIQKLINTIRIERSDVIQKMLSFDCSGTYVFPHCLNSAILIIIYGIENNMNEDTIYYLTVSAILHDVGMFYLERKIWNHEKKINVDKNTSIVEHPAYGAFIINSNHNTRGYSLIAYEHHERYNGKKGYPTGKDHKGINVYSRIFSIIDSFEAMIFERLYKKSFSPYDAVRIIASLSGIEYDQKYVNAFIRAFSLYPPGTYLLLNNKTVGRVLEPDKRSVIRPVINIINPGGIPGLRVVLFEHTDYDITKVLSEYEAQEYVK
ncbi:HD domain-containing protein [bacterium]|nr:HD domain-containing protein [bacterium]